MKARSALTKYSTAAMTARAVDEEIERDESAKLKMFP